MSNVLEIVTYKLKPGTKAGVFIRSAETMERDFALKQNGFVKRLFGKSEVDDWVDVITWKDMDSALQASAAAMKSPICAPMFGMLDETSIRMHHFTLL